MPSTQRLASLTPAGEIEIVERPVPDLGPNDVLVSVEASLISPGTEWYHIGVRRTGEEEFTDPRPMGYQNAGDVVECGQDVSGVSVGDRVACMGTGYALHSDYAVVPENLVVPLPPDVSYEEGAFNHLAGTALNGIRRAEFEIGEVAAVFGMGVVGQLTAQMAETAGGVVVAVGHHEGRVELGRAAGLSNPVAVTGSAAVPAIRERIGAEGLDCGFICFGGEGTETIERITELSREWPDGHETARVVIIGHVNLDIRPPTAFGNMDIRPTSRVGPGYHDPEYERGESYPESLVRWDTQRNLAESLRLISTGDLDVSSLITDRRPLTEAAEAYDLLRSDPDSTLGVILSPD